jgi:hypothetical protein
MAEDEGATDSVLDWEDSTGGLVLPAVLLLLPPVLLLAPCVLLVPPLTAPTPGPEEDPVVPLTILRPFAVLLLIVLAIVLPRVGAVLEAACTASEGGLNSASTWGNAAGSTYSAKPWALQQRGRGGGGSTI